MKKREEPHQVVYPPVKFLALYRYATFKEKLAMIIGLVAAMVSGATFPLTTVVFGDIIDSFGRWEIRNRVPEAARITEDEFMGSIQQACLYFVYLGIATFVATYIFMCIFVAVGELITYRVRKYYLQAILKQDIAWFDKEGAGEVATRLSSDTLLIQDGVSDKVPLALVQVCTAISGLTIAFVKSWKLTLVLLCVIPIMAITGFLMNKLTVKFQVRMLDAYSIAGNIAEESIAFVRTATAFGAQDKLASKYQAELVAARKQGIKKAAIVGFALGFLFFAVYLSYSLAFWFGAKLLNENEVSAGNVTNVFFAVLIGSFALNQIAPDLQAFTLARGAAAKIYYSIDRVPPIDSSKETGLKAEKFDGSIELKDVHFHYPSRPDVPILKGVSLKIRPGHSVALVGASGSGKSTIIQLVERFYDPISGTIEADGKPVQEYNLRWLRQQIGLVSQEPVLFEGTVKENILFGLAGTDLDKLSETEKDSMVEAACKQANAHDFILKLPHGYNTQVGERGLLLSGGQKQRIAIARAIVKNPQVLLLDEATSALDSTSEKVVQEALDKASKGRTTITIAHRLSTIKNADLIVVMSEGCIVEQGNHAELLGIENGAYKKLVNAQNLNNEKEKEAEGTSEHPKEVAAAAFEKEKSLQVLNDEEAVVVKKAGTFKVFGGILKLNAKETKYLIPGLLNAIVAGLVYPFFAIVFGTIIGVFNKRGDDLITQSNFWASMFVVIAFVNLLSNFLMNALFGFSAEFLTERIRNLTFRSILYQNIVFFDDPAHGTGALTARLSTDAARIQGISGVTIGSILSIVSTLMGGVVVALVTGWKLGLTAICCLPLLLLNGYFRVKIINWFADQARGAYEKSSQMACEAVSAIKTVQSLTREADVLNRYLNIVDVPLQKGVKSAFTNTILYALSTGINFLVNAFVFWYGGRLIVTDGYSTQQMFTVFIAIVFGSMGAGRMFAYAPDFNKAKEAAENILSLIHTRPGIWSIQGTKLDQPKGEVEFRDVIFRYPTRPHISVLNGLNITIKPGQFIALVGPSGCGKSTTIGLIERFYDVSGGAIFLDGKNIKDLDLKYYRSLIGLVSQEPNLFDMTIEENIVLGCQERPSEQQIIEACKEANIHEFISGLPMGYKTRVGAKGSQLSGGQKQRIAIARALIRKPKILLLDEATSALDAESEKVVQAALDQAAQGRTTIAIAHRLSTIQKADCIYVVQNGRVHEYGTHQELIDKKGLYFELVSQQSLEVTK